MWRRWWYCPTKEPDSHLEVKIDFDNTTPDKTAIAERAKKKKTAGKDDI